MKKSKPFRFRRFTIQQALAAFKVTGDSVFLGAWADVSHSKQILDLGTGTGLLALMAAQRNSQAQIAAIEKDSTSLDEARQNILNSPWHERITILEGDFIHYSFNHTFDHIICNPPYFSGQLPNPDARLRDARHAEPGFFDTLFRKGYAISTDDALLSLIIPEQGFELLHPENWFLHRKTILKTGSSGNKKLVCAEFRKTKPEQYSENELYIRNKEGYTKEYLEQTKAFYLFAPEA